MCVCVCVSHIDQRLFRLRRSQQFSARHALSSLVFSEANRDQWCALANRVKKSKALESAMGGGGGDWSCLFCADGESLPWRRAVFIELRWSSLCFSNLAWDGFICKRILVFCFFCGFFYKTKCLTICEQINVCVGSSGISPVLTRQAFRKKKKLTWFTVWHVFWGK